MDRKTKITRRQALAGMGAVMSSSLLLPKGKKQPDVSLAGTDNLLERLMASIPENLIPYLSAPERLMGPRMTADPWQKNLLRSRSDRVALNCSRQSGKSQVVAAMAIGEALIHPVVTGQPALVLLLSPTLRQSGELFRDKVKRLYRELGEPVPIKTESALSMELENGSRIISLPGEAGNVLGYSAVTLLVIDEASRVPDELYLSVRPMLAVSKGRMAILSTPNGKRGWFWEEFTDLRRRWERYEVTADECPRISKDFLEEERAALGERWHRQEYYCSFEDMIGAVFNSDDIRGSFSDEVTELPLWGT